MIEVRREVRPPWPFRLPGAGGMDGVASMRGGVWERLVHVEDASVVVRAAQPSSDRVVIGARGEAADVCEEAIARVRVAFGVDESLQAFYDRFRDDPWIGPSVRMRPYLRPVRRVEPFEALAWAICEQLITYEEAAEIERAIVWRLGRRAPSWDGTRTLRDLPSARTLGGTAPAQLQALGLSAARALALVKASREVASGRCALRCAPGAEEAGWARLRRISGIGSWTIAVLALHGQGRHDVLPAGDLAYLKLIGRARAGGRPSARATEEEVLEAFAPYEGWMGLAGLHALGAKATGGGAGTRFAAAA
jgi:3-methyladenine DNA glycosylase/8-oxoguanine DNA glycosylase